MLSKIACFLAVLIITGLLHPHPLYAQQNEELMEAEVKRVVSSQKVVVMDKEQLNQNLELEFATGSLKGRVIRIETGVLPMANTPQYQAGDKVSVAAISDASGNMQFFIRDFIRREYLYLLLGIFVLLTLLIARFRGVASLIGMAFSFFIIFKSILPNILAGSDPVVAVVGASILIIPVTFFLAHGFSKKTIVAIVSTFIAIIVTGILSALFVGLTRLTGFSSEEAGFLQVYKEGAINMRGLLLAGIIVGALGVLDDITISQSAVVFQLKEANLKLTRKELFSKAMNVGQDHISSMVNTLVLVYAGASLPLLLLFVNNPRPFAEVMNYEMIAEELVRTLVGSIGLILAVPLTTAIAAMVQEK